MQKLETVMEVCAQLAEQENLRVTVVESAKGAGITGISTLLGGLLGGKNGLLIGGAIGTAASYLMTSNFKSVRRVLREDMTEEQKRILYKRLNKLFDVSMLQNVGSAMAAIAANSNLKGNVLSVLTNYLRKDMGLNL